ncbi:MAG: calcium-binding protein [Nostoc sp. DedQUE01]|nr:calcium-binding protein [Nostoc sp. DedQUE01]
MPGGTNGPDNLVGIFDFPFLGIDFGDIIHGLGGNDTITGLGTNDTLNGNDGNDTLNGGGGADRLDGGDNDDLYIVDNVGDIATEVFGDALGGVDTVQASVSYTLSANLENLTLTGFAANGTGNARGNIINGNGLSNILSGLAGNDTINGGGGNDTINGGTGNDTITGGGGTDVLTGGLGNDVFNYDSISESLPGLLRDTINDFVGNGFGLGDQIDLSDIDANPFVAGNQAFSFIGAAAFTAVGQVSYIGGILRANTDFVFGFESEFDIQLAGAPAPALFVAAGNPGSDIIL